ncbi:serine hydroxymethyltransferase, partial [Candidatus Woesebacteria bacterium]|nr:serine hydroxymethyltransferase [Candidatus Woesebacteria bacterium]
EKDLEMGKKIDRAVFPGLQGGPHDNTTAGIAIALRFAQSENYKTYAKEVVNNAKMLSEELTKYGFDLVTNGTDNHLILIDLRRKNISGREFAERLEEAGVVVNYNAIPNDPNPPFNPSGIRLGTPALAARGMGEGEMKKIAKWISEVSERKDREKIAMEVKKLCEEFPID